MIAQAEHNERQALPITDGLDVNARKVQERIREGATSELVALRRALVKARADLAEFEAGRIM